MDAEQFIENRAELNASAWFHKDEVLEMFKKMQKAGITVTNKAGRPRRKAIAKLEPQPEVKKRPARRKANPFIGDNQQSNGTEK